MYVCVCAHQLRFELVHSNKEGVRREDELDDGKNIVAADQISSKFDRAGSDLRKCTSAAQHNTQLEEEADVSDAERLREDSDRSGDSEEGSEAESAQSDDSLRFVSARQASGAGPGSTAPSRQNSGKQSIKPGITTTPKKPQRPRPAGGQSSPLAAAATEKFVSKKGAAAKRGEKFDGKAPFEILQKHGIDNVLKDEREPTHTPEN